MTMNKVVCGGFFLTIVFSAASHGFGSSLDKVAFILMTQNHHSLHVQISNATKENLKRSLLTNHKVEKPKVYDLIHDWPIHGGWSLFKLFPRIKKLLPTTNWFVFIPENAVVDLKQLENVFSQFPEDAGIFLGRGLDNEDIQYIDVGTGYAMSNHLLVDLIKAHPDIGVYRIVTKFGYNLSKTLFDFGYPLQNEDQFCPTKKIGCAIYPGSIATITKNLSDKTHLLDSTLFAIKTCPKFHSERLDIVKKTWGQFCRHIIYVSDIKDEEHETVVLEGSDAGLCEKTKSIINFFADNATTKNWRWLVITDDDTLLGISKVLDLISTYDDEKGTDDKFVTIGERFGYRHFSVKDHNFDFLSGGSGMIFNYPSAKMISNFCTCSKISFEADDIFLGICLKNLEINIVHTHRLHQYPPEDYDPDVLLLNNPASFHKFDRTDPVKNYEKWFLNDDIKLAKRSTFEKTEL